MKKEIVIIDWFDIPTEVSAHCEGSLAVHKIPSADPKAAWTISHKQTGASVTGGFPPFNTRKEAKAFAMELLEFDDWYIEGATFKNSFDRSRVLELAKTLYRVWSNWARVV